MVEKLPARESLFLMLIGVVAAVVILVLIALPLLQGRVYDGGDLTVFHIPFRYFYWHSLAIGDDFRWCPYVFGGFDLHGEGQLGMYHPLHWLAYRFLPLAVAFAAELLASYPVMFLGTFLYLRGWSLPCSAAVFGALTFTFSGFNVMHLMHMNLIAVASHLPWLLWAADVAIRSPSPMRANLARLVLALLTMSQLLLGHPQAFWYTSLMASCYVVFLASQFEAWRRVPTLILAVGIGVLGGAVQWLPTWELLTQSTRSSPSETLLAYGSLSPLNLVQIVLPYLFFDRCLEGAPDEFVLYTGSLASACVLWAFVRRKELPQTGPLVGFLLAFAGVMMLLAFGEHTPLFQLHSLLPIVGKFRCPCRYILLIHWAAAVCSAVAFADLSKPRGPSDRIPSCWILALLPVASSIVAAGLYLWIELEPGTEFASRVADNLSTGLLGGPVLLTLAVVMIRAASRGVALALWGMMLFAAADQGYYAVSYLGRFTTASLADLTKHPLPESVPPERMVGGNDSLLQGRSTINGYVALFPTRYLTDHPKALRVAGVRTDQPPLPRQRLVTSTVLSGDPNQDLLRIDPEITALVDQELFLPAGSPGQVRLQTDRAGQLSLRTRADTRQFLVVAEGFHTGWEVRIDGEVAALVRAYGDFMGCVVEAGEHQVDFCFRPRSFTWGKWLSLGGVLAMLGTFLVGNRRLRFAIHPQGLAPAGGAP